MLIGSTSPAPYTQRLRLAAAPSAVPNSQGAPGAAPRSNMRTAALFSDGQFVGSAQLTSSANLSALFQLVDGKVQHGDLGSPVIKRGVTLDTPLEHMAKFMAMGPEETWSTSDRTVARDLAKITDNDKAMFRQITGYNLFISGPAAMIVDDEGNAPSEAEAAAADELFQRMRYVRESGHEIDAAWFSGISGDLATAGHPDFPSDWNDKAEKWFDQYFEARKDRPSLGEDKDEGQVRSEVSAAIAAYADTSGFGYSGTAVSKPVMLVNA
ncbi:hypothetical protein [Brevundimonas sp.]|uniref:hypothetical protein n=1 Tax=Brevundimonas sp. TaxID=1871086 RepID=UPI003D6CE018